MIMREGVRRQGGPTRVARARTALSRRVRAELDSSLLRNAYALILNSAGTAVFGAAYWFAAARLYDPRDVGRGSAAISMMMLLAGLVPLNLPRALTRLIPLAGAGTGRLVVRSYLFTAVCAGLAGVVFLAGVELWSAKLAYLTGSWTSAAWFAVSVMVWSIFALQDVVLTGLRSAVWVPLENALFGAAKLVLLVWLAARLPGEGVFVSWTVPVVFALLPVNVLIFRRLIPRHVSLVGERPRQPLGLRHMGVFLTGDYIGELARLASITLLPILVVDRFGPETNAYFYAAFTASWTVSLFADNIAAALTVEGSLDQSLLAAHLRRALRRLVALAVPLTAVMVAGASLVLRLYGREYAEAATVVLQLMAVAVLPHSLIMLQLGVARAQGRAGQLAVIQVVLCVLILGLSVILMGPLGITGVGVAWLVSQLVVAAAVVPALRNALRPAHGPDPGHGQQPA